MAVNAEFNRKHPRHAKNGRFREKGSADAGAATAYARRISDSIGARRGEKPAAESSSLPGAVARVKKVAERIDRGASPEEVDAVLHKNLRDHSDEELHAMRGKLLAGRGQAGSGMYDGVIARSIKRLLDKRES